MKIKVDKDEYWPYFYVVDFENDRYQYAGQMCDRAGDLGGGEFELARHEWEDYLRVEREWAEWQDRLRQMGKV
jgi:hypothetical protein